MSNHYSAGDYAGLSGGGFSFYYGYEETKDDDWAFVMKKGEKELLRFSATELGIRNGDDPNEGLLAGIGKALDVLYASKEGRSRLTSKLRMLDSEKQSDDLPANQ